MARRSLRLRALVALMIGVALPPATVAWAQANAPNAAPPAAASVGLGTQDLGEAKIRHALEDKTECDFAETPLADVIEYFKSKHDIEIQFDKKALQDEAIDGLEPVTRSLKGLKLKSALRLILEDLNLTYVVRNEVLLITSRTEAKAFTPTRIYPVQDLLAQWPAGMLRGTNLVEMISSVVQPTTWDENGGPGAIKLLLGTLVVSQTQAVHDEVAELLDLLRRTRKAQVAEQAAHAGPAAASDGKPAAKPMHIAVYRVTRVDSAGVRDSIIAIVAPQTWKENGGEGSIQLIQVATQKAEKKADTSTPAAVTAAPVRTEQFGGGGTGGANRGNTGGGGAVGERGNVQSTAQQDLLVVRQTDEVHEAIEELLDDIYRATGGSGTFCGEMGGGGGGLFRVRP